MRKLVCNFDEPDDDVFTLYDNWEKAVARFPHVSSSSSNSCFARLGACIPACTSPLRAAQ